MSSTTQRKVPEAKDSKCGFFLRLRARCDSWLSIFLFVGDYSRDGYHRESAHASRRGARDERDDARNRVLALRAGARYFSAACWRTDLKVRCSFQHDARRGGSPLRHTRAHLFVSSPVAYFAVFGVVTSAATMMVGQLAVQSTLGSWFVERRGVAMTRMMVIGASSSFIAPPAVNAIMGATGGGWRSGWYLIAALVALAIPVAFFLVKNHPSDIGEIPDGTSGAKVAAKKCDYRFVVYKNKESVPFKQVVRTPTFWLISLAATSGFAAYTLSTSQGVLHFTSLGFDSGLIVAGGGAYGGNGPCGQDFHGDSVRSHRADTAYRSSRAHSRDWYRSGCRGVKRCHAARFLRLYWRWVRRRECSISDGYG